MTSTRQILSELVSVFHDGMELYGEALDDLDEPALEATLKEMIAQREDAIRALKPHILETASWPEGDGTLSGTARQYLARGRTLIQSSKTAYLAELVKLEERRLNKVEDCFKRVPDAETKAVLSDLLLQFRSSAERMNGMYASSAD
jgi:uncharacterized protein (TIGR02284 family)